MPSTRSKCSVNGSNDDNDCNGMMMKTTILKTMLLVVMLVATLKME
jgi:hypothetical protein